MSVMPPINVEMCAKCAINACVSPHKCQIDLKMMQKCAILVPNDDVR